MPMPFISTRTYPASRDTVSIGGIPQKVVPPFSNFLPPRGRFLRSRGIFDAFAILTSVIGTSMFRNFTPTVIDNRDCKKESKTLENEESE